MRTVNRPPDQPVPAPSSSDHDALVPGTRFGEFEILRVLGVGGFGIVYLARDHSLERDVALKEYMPASLASRGEGPQITIRSSAFAETYAIGLRSFINEARLLARFDHPSLVKVYRFWEDNATAYMVMPYLQGITLRDARRGMTHAPGEAWIRSVIDPILSALELLHREGVYHRDIAPDNILLAPGGPPVLLDFGAARRVISGRTQSFTAILKPSYAPIEQYAEMVQLRQGPWTDLYALGAVVHYLLFGVPPQPATARAIQDDGASVADSSVPGVSPRMLESVDWALAVRPNERPQSIEEFRGALDGRVAIPQLGRQSITLPGPLAPRVAAAVAQPVDLPLPADESVSSGSKRLETGAAPAFLGEHPPATSAPATSFAPSLRPLMQVPPAAAAGPRTGAASRRAPSAAPPQSAAPAPAATRTAPVSAAPRVSTLRYVFAGLSVVALAAGVAIWLFGLPPETLTASVPAAPTPASAAASGATSSTEVADARTAPAASTRAAETLVVAAVEVPAVAVPAVVVAAAPSASASIVASPLHAEGPTAEARAASGASKSASTSTPSSATAASRPKSAPRKPESAATVAESGSQHSPQGAGARPGPPHEVQMAPPAAPADPVGPASAREACGGRVFLARAVCMDRECEQPRFRNTAECIPILERKRARENR